MISRTIRRNSPSINRIFDNAENIKVYSLENGFTGRSANKIGWDGKNWLLKEYTDLPFAKLTKTTDEKGQGQYCLHVHSNFWVEFEISEPKEDKALIGREGGVKNGQ